MEAGLRVGVAVAILDDLVALSRCHAEPPLRIAQSLLRLDVCRIEGDGTLKGRPRGLVIANANRGSSGPDEPSDLFGRIQARVTHLLTYYTGYRLKRAGVR